MNSIVTSRENIKSTITISSKTVFSQGILACFIVGLVIISIENYLLFHSIVELFVSVIALFIFIMCVNTYDISSNNYFLTLGSGFFWSAIVNLFHAASFKGIGIIRYISPDVHTQSWIVGRYIGAITMLVSVIVLYKPIKKFKFSTIFSIYSLIAISLILSIYYFRIFPSCYVVGKGVTVFKIISDVIISSIYILTAILCFKVRRKREYLKLKYIMLTCIISMISEVLLAFSKSIHSWFNTTGHILMVISFYYMYKGIVEIGLKRPYFVMGNNLKSKEMELEFINEMLKRESFKRRDVEEVLISNEKCYEMLVEYSRDAIMVHRDGRYIFANEGAAKLLGVESADDLIGMSTSSFMHTDNKELVSHRTMEIYNEKCSLPFVQMKIIRADGEVLDIESGSAYFSFKGKPAILTIVRDISYIKEVKSLKKDIEVTKEYNRVLMEFFSNISHELKTPLNVILGAIQILNLPKKVELPNEFQENLSKYLKTMKQNCYRLLRLVNNLIDQSKVDSGYLKLSLKNLDIVNVVENITLSVADYAGNKGIEMIFDTDIEEKLMAFDADKIERIILNLLSNAIKFVSSDGEILVSLYDKGDKVQISVKDTGIGIPEDKLNLIFDRFGQVDKTLARNKEGSGIGLSLVKSLVDMHNGTITVNSKFGEGSEFIIELPAYITDIEDERLENSMYQSSVERISIEFSDIYN
ncbi:MASE3 domain-containing sensor histidine kinase [Clostridium cylindrosporum]|uniref:histidine kinase n=1 Tax=Clostridium cylindrosporum DSM 605 TaxID=1121307 RepID=A0A0J8G3G1_CLOCY|nr:MASE3 domain-containing protein [Clostridium cylindrosporum]KMT22246.1 sensor histidine kinase ResE [Clostridium cylindrosporum DSM 605]